MRILMLIVLAVALLIPCSAWGMWAWTDPQVLVDQADYVVQGTITDVNREAGQANIEVEETLKGTAKKKIPVKFAPVKEAGGMILSDSSEIRYGEGMKGIWILDRPDANGRYDLSYPPRRMQVEELNQAKALVADFNNIKWSKPVNGLVAAVRAHRPSVQNKPVSMFDLYLVVKNVSDKRLFVQAAGGAMTMNFKLQGPQGERLIGLPETFRAVPEKTVRLDKDQMIYVGFDWPAGLSTGELKQDARYTVTGFYTYQSDKLKNITEWMGTIQTEPLELKLSPK